MPGKPKYKAKHVFWDSKNEVVKNRHDINIYRCHGKLKLPEHIWRFDSQHEFKVYLQLVRMYGKECVLRQHRVRIIEPGLCYPNGKYWKADFAIRFPVSRNYTHWLVEAKGAFLPEFASVLSLLEDNQNDLFYRTRIIFPGKPPTKNRVVQALLNSSFKGNLLSLQEVEKLRELP